ncbi:LexA family protein [Paenibacillus senegalensis]|uniref:LexA family protein n=1 Tax=Paenibacillus senegalensis TaxID=1465766 RepID=UPI000287BFEE|nr:heme-binding protein [Paenibacillus senegalensis]
MRITNVQRKVILAINEFVSKHNYSPTVREISKMMGWSSPSTAHGCLMQLKKKGFVTWEPALPRTLKVNEDRFVV